MPPRTGQGLATWLMFVPLLVVPLIAVFGVPQFTPGSAQAESSSADDLEIGLGTAEESPFGEEVRVAPQTSVGDAPVFESAQESFSSGDPFQNPEAIKSPQNFTDPAPRRPGDAADVPSGDPFAQPPPLTPDGQPNRADVFPQPDATPGFQRRGDSADDRDRSAATLRENLTWRDAVRKLNQLGVRQYSLEPAAEANMFRFSCDFTPGDNPRLTHRFEAEAGQPLSAVRKVIQQVESWLAQRNSP